VIKLEFKYGTPQEAGLCPSRVRQVEHLVNNWVEQQESQAFAFVIARKGIIVSHQAFGSFFPGQNSPNVSRDTIFPLASLSKPVTGTAALMLAERGQLSLSFPVSYYIPEFVGESKEKVLLWHLMTHTSGLRDEDIYAHSEKKQGQEVPAHSSTQHPDIHRKLFLGYDTPLWKTPGTEMSYCNYGVELLGEIVRRVSGQSLDQFCNDNIFTPLQMKDSHFIIPEAKYNRVIQRGENLLGGKWFHTPEAMNRPSAAGGLYSTVLDMAKFGQMFLNKGIYGGNRVLSPASVTEMTRNQIPHISSTYGEEYFAEASYGYNWSVNGYKKDNGDLLSPSSFNHGGAGGVTLTVDPIYEMVMVLFSIEGKINDGHGIWYPHRYLFNNVAISTIVD
jgi:CubicO group peptidase (beta-lactamase class C family)